MVSGGERGVQGADWQLPGFHISALLCARRFILEKVGRGPHFYPHFLFVLCFGWPTVRIGVLFSGPPLVGGEWHCPALVSGHPEGCLST